MKRDNTAEAIIRAHMATPAEEALRVHVAMLEGEIERLRGIIADMVPSDDDDEYGRGFDAGMKAAHCDYEAIVADMQSRVEEHRNDAARAYRHVMDAQEAARRWRRAARWFGALALTSCFITLMRGAQ